MAVSPPNRSGPEDLTIDYLLAESFSTFAFAGARLEIPESSE
jgi:hypothetical protein